MMCIFEISSALLTTFRSIQALRVGGPWYTQKKSFVYLLLEQGVIFLIWLYTLVDLSYLGVLYFWYVHQDYIPMRSSD
jgi:maltodextrin utilization protein YvdJ